MREIVLDTETTGLDPQAGDRIVEIGCVELINHVPSGITWQHYFNPQCAMPKEAFAVHGLSDEFLSDKPLFVDLKQSFLEFIGDARLVIHNAEFDIGFLNAELGRLKEASISSDRVTDTLLLARRKHPGTSVSLDALCRRYSIDNSARAVHGALKDALLLADVYQELIGGRQSSLILTESTRIVYEPEADLPIRARPTTLVSHLSKDEMDAHRSAISTLGKAAIWAEYDMI